jgi:SAM-dependent methyltransferase
MEIDWQNESRSRSEHAGRNMNVIEVDNEYDATADYCDMLFGDRTGHIAFYDVLIGDRTIDIPFWVELAKRFGSPILEFACGTGRLSLPIARAGVEIVGLDISARMLAKAHAALQQENAAVYARVTFMHTNINAFQVSPRFTAVFSPWGFHAVTAEEQDRCLRLVREHLRPHGYFVVDILNRKEPTENWSHHDLMYLREFPEPGLTLVRQSYQKGDASTRLVQTVFFLDAVSTDGTMKRLITKRTIRIYTYNSLQQLLYKHGFKVEEVYGSYDFQPFDEMSSERAIFVTRLL